MTADLTVRPEAIWMLLGVAIGAYLIGSVNLTLVACRLLKIADPRAGGSGNPGVTNLYRTAGLKAAAPILLIDLGKAAGVIWGAHLAGLGHLAPAFALPYLLGNLYPVFHGFKGGKGVAAVVGVFIAIDYRVMLAAGGIFIPVFIATRRVSVGSLSMALSYPLWALVFGASPLEIIVAGTIGAVLFFTHR